MRTKLAGEFGKVLPANALLNIEYYQTISKSNGLINMKFTFDGLPMSLNNHYDIATKYCKPGTPGAFRDNQGRWRQRSHKLKPRAIDWRMVVQETMGQERWKWQPRGVTAAILLFESPEWIKKDHTVRPMDADNRVKGTFDAVQAATEVPDELMWQFHVYKVLSKRTRTTIFLYELSDVVEYYY